MLRTLGISQAYGGYFKLFRAAYFYRLGLDGPRQRLGGLDGLLWSAKVPPDS